MEGWLEDSALNMGLRLSDTQYTKYTVQLCQVMVEDIKKFIRQLLPQWIDKIVPIANKKSSIPIKGILINYSASKPVFAIDKTDETGSPISPFFDATPGYQTFHVMRCSSISHGRLHATIETLRALEGEHPSKTIELFIVRFRLVMAGYALSKRLTRYGLATEAQRFNTLAFSIPKATAQDVDSAVSTLAVLMHYNGVELLLDESAIEPIYYHYGIKELVKKWPSAHAPLLKLYRDVLNIFEEEPQNAMQVSDRI
eukprot:GHVT01053771.1.p1 GENE.GHVT01053771.1~~GHVT01053771.1.p1  ORF type:complete len:255 (-),score=14.05 GHVT01053771.1:2563-3327(-)